MALGLVSLMKPIDVMKVLVKHLDILPKEAAKLAYDLRRRVEGLGGSIEIQSGGEYPVPPPNKKDAEELKEGPALARANGKTMYTHGPDIVKRHHFPPDPRGEPQEWPYDSMTMAGMRPGNRSPRRPLMNGKNPLDPNAGPPLGGDGPGGRGIYSKSAPHARDNSTSTTGNSTWVKQGTPGWSSSPPDKEFDLPESEKRPDNAGDEDDEPKFLKQPNTGAQLQIPGQPRNITSPYRGFRKR